MEPHKIFLITEILELILLETDMRTLLTSAQRVCHKWHSLIQHSSDLQAALFLKPSKYTLPRGILGLRNPLLEETIWPWFCAKQARVYRAPPVEGGAQIPPMDPQYDQIFLREEASWKRMLFQQPPRSSIGILEKATHTYTEVKVQPEGDHLRINDIMGPWKGILEYIHPLVEDGIFWFGDVPDFVFLEKIGLRGYLESVEYGEIPKSQVVYATSVCLKDCDVVLFNLQCGFIRGDFDDYRWSFRLLNYWLHKLQRTFVPGQMCIPMPVD